MKPVKTHVILNLGAGVQSTTLYLMSMRGVESEFVPKIDCAIFADTGEEPEAVYRHLDWLKSLGGPPIMMGSAGRLGDDLLAGRNSTGQRFASIPAYTKGEGDTKEGRVRRQCTREYKVQVIERVIRCDILGLVPRQRFPSNVRVIQVLGLSFDEPRRIISTQSRFQAVAWSEPRFPLFDLQMSRRDCLAWLETQDIPHAVPRSACVFCPFHTNAEWRAVRANPADWGRACAIDEALRREHRAAEGLDWKLYVHRSCIPLREASIDTPESRGEQYLFGFAQECEGMCRV